MSFQECVKFANEVRRCFLATVDGDQPRVRTFGMCFADDTGFYFQTESVKSVSKQLKKNGKVEVLFWFQASGGSLLLDIAEQYEGIGDRKSKVWRGIITSPLTAYNMPSLWVHKK